MTTRVQRLRHNAASAALFVGLLGEITVDYETHALHLHDGSTPGGFVISTDTQLVALFQPANSTLASLAALVSSGLLVKAGVNVITRTLVAGHGILITNADGQAGYISIRTDDNWGSSVPIGGVIMWTGPIASVPNGYQFCNGQNGSVNMQNRFVVCANADVGGIPESTITGAALQTYSAVTAVNAGGDHAHSGITNNYSLLIADIPSHFHGEVGAGSNGQFYDSASVGTSGFAAGAGTPISSGVNTSPIGGGGPHHHGIDTSGTHVHNIAVIPTFFALAYIQRMS